MNTTPSKDNDQLKCTPSPVSPSKARKRGLKTHLWKRNAAKKLRYSDTGHTTKALTCVHKTGSHFYCNKLTGEAIFKFRSSFYKNTTKELQDAFILKHISVMAVNRRRPREEATSKHSRKEYSCRYFFNVEHGQAICQKAFISILSITRARVEAVSRSYAITGNIPKNRRGGNHMEKKFGAKRLAVIDFISKLQCSEPHYCRSQTAVRKYLPSSLSIKKLSKMYNQQAVQNFQVKESFFRSIFNTRFNLGFGSPRVDVCSTCLELGNKIKLEKNSDVKDQLRVQRAIHKKKAAAFFELLRTQEPNLKVFSFDCQKNLVNPKIPDQEAYYRRQIYLYHFAIVEGPSKSPMSKKNCYSYVWPENVHAKDSNSIASAVYRHLETTDLTNITKIRMFADGCGGQNKNSILLAMAARWLQQTKNSKVQEVEIIFPIRGHSFIPPDRLFGLSEKEFKKMEEIENPDEYRKIIQQYSTVIKFGEDCECYDWKTQATTVFKTLASWHFKFAPCKRYIMKRSSANHNNILFRGEEFYKNNLCAWKFLTKKNKTISSMNPNLIVPNSLKVNSLKLEDTRRLLELHYGTNWAEFPQLSFYQELFDNQTKNDNLKDAPEEDLCEEMENENSVLMV